MIESHKTGKKRFKMVGLNVVLWSAFFLFPAVLLGEIDDPYDLALVKSFLKTYPKGIHIGKIQTHMQRLGDKVGIALLKISSGTELKNSQTIREFLSAIHLSFEHPEFISLKEDRDPRVTLFFLEHLERDVNDPEVRQEILQTIKFIKEKTAAR